MKNISQLLVGKKCIASKLFICNYAVDIIKANKGDIEVIPLLIHHLLI